MAEIRKNWWVEKKFGYYYENQKKFENLKERAMTMLRWKFSSANKHRDKSCYLFEITGRYSMTALIVMKADGLQRIRESE